MSNPVVGPVVAIVGRPNVGKSSLFNRLAARRAAIVADEPGVTRDRLYVPCVWNGKTFTLVDTGGIDPFDTDELRNRVFDQARQALDEAALILLVVDGQSGVHPLDTEVAELLRRSKRPVVLVVNKAENQKVVDESYQFYELGLGDPWPVSASHGTHSGDLLDHILEQLGEFEPQEEPEETRLVLVGRPNVGKSSLLNRLIGEDRSLVHDVAGTTRDAIDTMLEYEGRQLRLVDTAGIRRKALVEEEVEYFSTVRALKALKRSDVALLVVDAEQGVVAQDKRVAGYIRKEGVGSVIVVNKWDRLTAGMKSGAIAEKQRRFSEKLVGELEFISYSPVLYVSALTGFNCSDILPAAMEVADERARRLDTPTLNRVVREAMALRPPPSYKGRSLKVLYVSQRGVRPPVFAFKCNSGKLVHFSYRRYLENQLRDAFGLVGTPIEMRFLSR
ncbi:ribosome biogenesis GTPase Der [bacterium CPR1]|nr:ribosome biogenesis GTPase Der [bacterium CPR1]